MPPSPPLAHGSTDVVSPRAHGFSDLAAFSITLGWAAWTARRSKRAGAIVRATALGEGATAAIAQYPNDGLPPLISFCRPVRIGPVGGSVLGVPQPGRSALVFPGLLPLVANGLSGISGQPEHAA